MDEVQLKEVAREAAREAVREVMLSLGIDAANPLEMQARMNALRTLADREADAEFEADLVHLRKWRKAVDGATGGGFLTIVGVLVSGTLAAVWLGLREMLK